MPDKRSEFRLPVVRRIKLPYRYGDLRVNHYEGESYGDDWPGGEEFERRIADSSTLL